jgi:hypothetical protein
LEQRSLARLAQQLIDDIPERDVDVMRGCRRPDRIDVRSHHAWFFSTLR